MVDTSSAGALPPPPGVTPNMINPAHERNRGWIGCLTILLIIPSILVPLRIYVKRWILKSVTLTDYICFLAWLTFLAFASTTLSLLKFDAGFHGWDVSVHTFSGFAHRINIVEILYIPAILLTKCAILLQLVEIFIPSRARNSRWFILFGLIGTNSVFFALCFFLELFECSPRQKIWKPKVAGHCINIEQTYIATGTINVVDDLTILVLPLLWTWKLQLPTKKKFGISMIFAAGFFACITSIMRLSENVISLNNPDITRTLVPVALWANGEISSGLVVCCLPVLPRLFRRSGPQNAQIVVPAAENTSVYSHRKSDYRELDEIPLQSISSGDLQATPSVNTTVS